MKALSAMRRLPHTLLLIALAVILTVTGNPASARKKGYTLTTPENSKADVQQEAISRGSFMVASQCNDCNNGYKLDQISFAGYDKPANSKVETFHITNHTDRVMTGLNMYVEYRDLKGRQLHKRFLRMSCMIPPGETRMAEIPSWDHQKSFRFVSSQDAKRPATPYTVIFDPVAFYLRF